MLGSCSCVHVGSGKNFCAVTTGGGRGLAAPGAQGTAEIAGVVQDQTGNFAQIGTGGPLNYSPTHGILDKHRFNGGFLLRTCTIMNTELLSQEYSSVLI